MHRISLHAHPCAARFDFITAAGEQELPGLTDEEKPRQRGPKRASKIRKMFNLTKVGSANWAEHNSRWSQGAGVCSLSPCLVGHLCTRALPPCRLAPIRHKCTHCSGLTAALLPATLISNPQDDDVRHYVKIYGKKVEKVRNICWLLPLPFVILFCMHS